MTTQPHPTGVRLLPWRVPPWVFDVALISIAVLGFARRPFTESSGIETVDVVALIAGIGLLLVRRRAPLPALAASVGGAIVLVSISDRPTMLLPVALALLFTVGLQHSRRTAIIAGLITTVLFAAMIIALVSGGEIDGAGLASVAWPAFAATAGVVVRGSRENLAIAQERAERAELSRELEAERRVVEERLRIARDVHDLVAHHLAVINVQSGVAGHLIEADPTAAAEALDVVRGSASTAVDQLGELLGVLRSPEDDADPTTPTPNLDAIEDLISSFSSSGLRIERRTSGSRRPLSASAELAAYRMVQEALTNAHKHGDGSASVAQEFHDDGLIIVVANPASPARSNGSGFGLIGMRERVEAAGGTLDIAESSDGTSFVITAKLPLKADR